MNSVQESKNELDAAIRYAENAISSAKATIESMEFRQEMAKKTYQEQTAREYALAKREEELEREVAQLKSLLAAEERESAVLRDTIDRMGDDITGDSVTIKQLQNQLDDMRASAFEDAKTIEQLKERADSLSATCQRLKEDQPTMPVIPKDVAIAIFREGVQSGVVDAVSELEGQTINICENEYCGDFEVTFARDIHLDDEIDFDWMREKAGQYNEDFVVGALKGLCALKDFECRIHGVDDQEEKKND